MSKGDKIPTDSQRVWLIAELTSEQLSDTIAIEAQLYSAEAGDHVEDKPDDLLLGKCTKIIRLHDDSRNAGESNIECSTSPAKNQNIQVSDMKARLLARSREVISRQYQNLRMTSCGMCGTSSRYRKQTRN